ncbi:hypothetical protein EDB89DRAFT_2072095 [Lactarius sanguifluus]|nr:hypothetical protein EDB89DRAFT_2072095 [Lactarius sanguifluus]
MQAISPSLAPLLSQSAHPTLRLTNCPVACSLSNAHITKVGFQVLSLQERSAPNRGNSNSEHLYRMFPSHLWRSVILAWASLGKHISANAPEFTPKAFTFTLPPDVPQFPQSQPPSTPLPRSSSPLHATVDAEPIRAQQGSEKRQCCSSVGSITASDVSGDGRVVMISSKFPQESPTCKSALPSPAQRPGASQIGLNYILTQHLLPDLSCFRHR